MDNVQKVGVGLIDRDETQPRVEFNQEDLDRLANSMKDVGLLQPITVRRVNGRYQLVAGERRWRAAIMLGWSEIPAMVREMEFTDFRKMQLLENVVRADLNPIEYARGLKQMLDEGMTSKDIADALGDDAGNVSYHVAILDCRPEVLHLVATRQIGVVVARQIAYLSLNAQMGVLKRFQLHHYDTDEQVAICRKLYAEEN